MGVYNGLSLQGRESSAGWIEAIGSFRNYTNDFFHGCFFFSTNVANFVGKREGGGELRSQLSVSEL